LLQLLESYPIVLNIRQVYMHTDGRCRKSIIASEKADDVCDHGSESDHGLELIKCPFYSCFRVLAIFQRQNKGLGKKTHAGAEAHGAWSGLLTSRWPDIASVDMVRCCKPVGVSE
jgi:hypothetical protein